MSRAVPGGAGALQRGEGLATFGAGDRVGEPAEPRAEPGSRAQRQQRHEEQGPAHERVPEEALPAFCSGTTPGSYTTAIFTPVNVTRFRAHVARPVCQYLLGRKVPVAPLLKQTGMPADARAAVRRRAAEHAAPLSRRGGAGGEGPRCWGFTWGRR